MTLAHELGHGRLHNGPTMARKKIETSLPNYIAAHQSAEHQAKVFAAAFLMPERLVSTCSSVEEIARIAAVSSEAARIQWELLHKVAHKQELARKLKSLSAEIRDSSAERPGSGHYLVDPCPICKRQSLSPLGQRAFCAYCERTFEG